MAPHHAGERIRPQNAKRGKKCPESRHSEQAITKNNVPQPGSFSHSKTGSSPTTSRNAVRGTAHPQKKGTPSAQNLPPNSPPTTATTSSSSSQPLTTVENAKTVHISGGTFLNSLETVVQYGGFPSERQPVKSEEIPHGLENSLAVPDLEDIGNGDTEAQSACQLTKSNGKTTANSQPQIKDYDIYYHQLLFARRGSPMWRPGPSLTLPNEYRRNGIGIGDVGIIYRSEGFGFLFNIFLPADHPVNKGNVPDDFEPLDFGQVKRDLEKTIVYGRGHHLASSALRNVSGVDSSGLVFETFASEGAILIMPDGATTEDLFNHISVEKYIAKNAQSWYTYIMEVRGRRVRNGDVRLVMGVDKVASWAIATFASSAGEQVRLEFKTNNSDQAASRAYTWNCVGSGSGRVGPHEEEMDGLREPNDAEFVLKNQTVFVRTLNFNLNGEAWDNALHEIRSSDHSSNDSGPPSSHQPPSSPPGGQSSSGSRESHSGQGSVNFQTAQFGLSVNQHPSNQINDLLLKKFPNAQIVITDDADWISVLTEEDVMFPSPEKLCARLLSSRKIREKDGVITFYDNRANSADELTVTGERNLNFVCSSSPSLGNDPSSGALGSANSPTGVEINSSAGAVSNLRLPELLANLPPLSESKPDDEVTPEELMQMTEGVLPLELPNYKTMSRYDSVATKQRLDPEKVQTLPIREQRQRCLVKTEFNVADTAGASVTAAGGSNPPNFPLRHPKYYIEGGDLHVVAGGMLFCVHSYFFIRESTTFLHLMSPSTTREGSALQELGATRHKERHRRGETDQDPVILSITAQDFETFLGVFYNPRYSVYDNSVEQWTTILRLAQELDFKEVEKLAVRELNRKPDSKLSLVDRLALYQEHRVDPRHLVPLYVELSAGDTPLTLAEATGKPLEGEENTETKTHAKEVDRSVYAG